MVTTNGWIGKPLIRLLRKRGEAQVKSLASYYFLFYLAMSVFLFMPYTSLYFSDRGFSHTTVGLILSLWALVSVVAQPVMGLINDRINNPRKIMMICAVAAPVLGLGFHFMNGLVAFFVFFLLGFNLPEGRLAMPWLWKSPAEKVFHSAALGCGER